MQVNRIAKEQLCGKPAATQRRIAVVGRALGRNSASAYDSDMLGWVGKKCSVRILRIMAT